MLFLKRPKHPKPTREQFLASRPVRLVDDAVQPDTKGGGQLKVKMRQARWAGTLFRMPDGTTKTFELDEIGLLVWNACDGKTSVKRLIERVADTYGVTLREAEVSTQAFLQTLVKKNLVGVPIAGHKNEERG